MKKTIAVVTGTRAEYGLLSPLMKSIKSHKAFNLQVLVTGSHLLSVFGNTYKAIEADGFTITAKVSVPLQDDSEYGVSKALGTVIEGFGKLWKTRKPDFVVILGDRYEMLGVAIAAQIARIPIVHLHGGEVTEGAIDDSFRHCITKMSALHLVSTKEYRKRVIQLGENPKRVFTVGAIGIDNIRKLNLLDKDALEKQLNFRFGKRTIIVTFHPVTLEKGTEKVQTLAMLNALRSFKDTSIIFTYPNADTHNKIIRTMIESFVKRTPENTALFASLGQLKYLSVLRYVDAMVGNSSSGIIEAPSFKIPTINIGDRQKGRISAASVIHCEPTARSIQAALQKAFSPEFRNKCRSVVNPYGTGTAVEQIMKVLQRELPKINDTKKSFYDMRYVPCIRTFFPLKRKLL